MAGPQRAHLGEEHWRRGARGKKGGGRRATRSGRQRGRRGAPAGKPGDEEDGPPGTSEGPGETDHADGARPAPGWPDRGGPNREERRLLDSAAARGPALPTPP